MAHVITQACCNDASCVPVCPVGCIHPEPGSPGFAAAETLHIDPTTCIDCGACVPACPVGAIVPEDRLSGTAERYREVNADYFVRSPIRPALAMVTISPPPAPVGEGTLRVAIVGSGPAGSYAALELLRYPNVEIEVFDRLPTPWGLIRAGVAPDHQSTKEVVQLFERAADDWRVRFHLNVEIGADLSHDELTAHHHAVIYAHGAPLDRRLGILGEDLAGSGSATEFVNWYNGHPDFATRTYDLATQRAIVIGNGNVALDVARILVTDPNDLATTDIAAHAVAALRASAVREVVVLGRRGPRDAAYSASELLALADLAGVDVHVEIPSVDAMGTLAAGEANLKERVAYELAGRRGQTANRLITLKFFSSPVEITGDTRVTGLAVARTRLESASDGGVQAVVTDDHSFLEAGLVLRSVGYRGRALAGLPFDDDLAIVPNDQGRVVQRNGVMPGVYATGWIKRGARGVIGTNRECARETVANLVADHRSGRLSAPTHDSRALADLVGERQPAAIGLKGWRSIDRAERDAGRAVGSPRRKLTGRAELLAAAEPATGDCPEA